jgi:hypothetical protein
MFVPDLIQTATTMFGEASYGVSRDVFNIRVFAASATPTDWTATKGQQ